MLRELGSDDPRFRTVRFRPGLNLIVADRTATSTPDQSRNALGKTSVVELLRRHDADVLVAGAGGKMGGTLCLMLAEGMRRAGIAAQSHRRPQRQTYLGRGPSLPKKRARKGFHLCRDAASP